MTVAPLGAEQLALWYSGAAQQHEAPAVYEAQIAELDGKIATIEELEGD